MAEQISAIMTQVDFCIEIMENSEVLEKINMDYMKGLFKTCVFVENVIKKVEAEQKETNFESHLNAWRLKKKKSIIYKCSNLKNVTDKILELCLKEEKIQITIIDEFLKMYVNEFGSIRLEAFINCMLKNSMQINALMQVLKNLKFPEEDIKDEVLLVSWEHEIQDGKKKIVKKYILDMFEKQCTSKLIQLAYISVPKCQVKKLILDFFSKKLSDNNIVLYLELIDAKRKILLKLLDDNLKFQLNFVDTTFYMGRIMKQDQEHSWITDDGFCYEDLKGIIRTLLDGSEDLYSLMHKRIKLAKELDAVWKDIEHDCIL